MNFSRCLCWSLIIANGPCHDITSLAYPMVERRHGTAVVWMAAPHPSRNCAVSLLCTLPSYARSSNINRLQWTRTAPGRGRRGRLTSLIDPTAPPSDRNLGHFIPTVMSHRTASTWPRFLQCSALFLVVPRRLSLSLVASRCPCCLPLSPVARCRPVGSPVASVPKLLYRLGVGVENSSPK